MRIPNWKAVALSTAIVVLGGWSTLAADPQRAQLTGTWYLALDLSVIGLPGATLPAVASFHRDGTFNISDPGDLASVPFLEFDTTQYGSWVRAAGGTFRATTLFLRKHADGQLEGWHRVRFTLRFAEDSDHLEGVVTEEVLECPAAGPTPFPLFNCPNPMTTRFTPLPLEIPISGVRLKVRG